MSQAYFYFVTDRWNAYFITGITTDPQGTADVYQQSLQYFRLYAIPIPSSMTDWQLLTDFRQNFQCQYEQKDPYYNKLNMKFFPEALDYVFSQVGSRELPPPIVTSSPAALAALKKKKEAPVK